MSNETQSMCGFCGYPPDQIHRSNQSSSYYRCKEHDSILTHGNEVIVKFTSDVSITGKGFWLDYIASMKIKYQFHVNLL